MTKKDNNTELVENSRTSVYCMRMIMISHTANDFKMLN